MPVLTINDKPLYYEVSGKGKPLVLLHGTMMNCRMWDICLVDLRLYFQVIVPDLYGYGQSKWADSRITDHVADMRGLLEALNIPKANFLGHSMGAEVAMDFAIEYPQMVENLVLVSSGLIGYDYPESAQAWWHSFITAVKARDFETAKTIFMTTFVDGRRFKTYPQDKKLAREMLNHYDFGHYLDDSLQSKPYPPAIEYLTRIKAPTLILAGGDDDPVYATIASLLEDKIPNSHRAIFPKAGHFPHWQTPDDFLIEVMNFLVGDS